MDCLVTERLCKNPIAMGRCVLMRQFMCMDALYFQYEGCSYRERQSQCQLHFSSGSSDIREKEPSRKNTRAPTFRIWFQSLLRACKM